MEVTKKPKIDYPYDGEALTLPCDCVFDVQGPRKPEEGQKYSRTHASGWTIHAALKNDWFWWINEFEAFHPKHGRVWGDFEIEVHADSEAGFQDFYAQHPPDSWSYAEI